MRALRPVIREVAALGAGQSLTSLTLRFDGCEKLDVASLGAGLALCGLATAIVDALLLYALPLRKTFKGLKYDTYGADEEGGCDALALGGERGGVARVNDEDEQAEPLIR